MRSCDIHLGVISQETFKIFILDVGLKITWWRLQLHVPGDNELTQIAWACGGKCTVTSHERRGVSNHQQQYFQANIKKYQSPNYLALCDGNPPDWRIPITKGQRCGKLSMSLSHRVIGKQPLGKPWNITTRILPTGIEVTRMRCGRLASGMLL